MTPTLPLLESLAKRLHPHTRGWLAENLARFYYQLHGYSVWKSHRQPGLAQADLTLSRGLSLVVVEVKYRNNRQRGHLALKPDQRQRLNSQLQALAGRYPKYTLRLEVFLVFPHFPFLQRIRHVD